MKKILASMIIIIELLCFCNTTIAMAMSNVGDAEVEQKVTNSVDSNTVLLDEQDKMEETVETEEKIQEDKGALEIPKQEENVLEDVKDVKVEEQKKTNNNEVPDNVTNEEKQEENQVSENVLEPIVENEDTNNNNETEVNDTPDNQEEDKVITLTFPYSNTTYSVDLSSKELGVDLNTYAYYFVKKMGVKLDLYCSNERFKIKGQDSSNGQCKISGGTETIRVIISEEGNISKSILDLVNRYHVAMNLENYIASNQNIYYGNEIYFTRNCGYKYDEANEKGEHSNEVIKINTTKVAYEKPALNYDVLSTLEKGAIIKRIKKEVNTANGYVWDKVQLMDGREAYIVSEDMEVIPDAKETRFKYNGKTYIIYILPTNLGVDLKEYEYYMVTKGTNSLTLYCSKNRIKVNYGDYKGQHIGVGKDTISVYIDTNTGKQSQQIISTNEVGVASSSNIVATNHNIWKDNYVFFSKNCGYEYDETKEKEETCDEIVRTIKDVNVYAKPSVVYDITSTLSKGTAIKRIKKTVNEVNGHVWDKIVLSDGQEKYVMSDELELIENKSDIKSMEFTYSNKKYIVYLLSTSLGVDLKEYEYYMVTKGANSLTLYCSKNRIKVNYGDYKGQHIGVGKDTIAVSLDTNTGKQSQQIISTNEICVASSSNIVATNHNIWKDNYVFFSKNCGYEYDLENEKEETCDEIVKTLKKVNIYEKPSMNYDIIGTIDEEIAVRRVKKTVNDVNGRNWDKIELSVGTYGYVLSDELELATNAKGISFRFNNIIYKVYFPVSIVGIDLNKYEHFFVRKLSQTEFEFYYSDEPIKIIQKNSSSGEYKISGGTKTILINISTQGTLKKNIIDFDKNSKYVAVTDYVASNRDICYNDIVIFNSKYVYKKIDDVVAVKAYFRYNKISGYNEHINAECTQVFLETLKKFQMKKGLTESGNIDDATLKEMNLDDINEYNTYLKMGYNYNQHKNPYGPSCYLVPGSDTYNMKFELGRKRAEFYSQVEYDEQERKYDSMEYVERVLKDHAMTKAEKALKVLATVSYTIYPHASDGITHFLSNSGENHYVNDVENVFKLGKSGENRSDYLEHTKKAIEHMLTIDKAVDFSMEKTLPLKLPIPQNEVEIDWFGLYGTYNFSVEGSCYKKGNTYVANGYCYVRDYYDFDKVDLKYIYEAVNHLIDQDKKFDYEDIVTSILAELHYAGRAKFFYIEGKDNGFLLEWKSTE